MIKIISKPKTHFSPLRYPGGKSCLSDFLSSVILENRLSDCIYVEPYAGGAGAALTLLMLEKVEKIIINDFDKSIFLFWKSILEYPEKFIEKIRSAKLDLREWSYQKKIYQGEITDDLSIAFSTFYLNRTNRSGIIGGGPIGGMGQNSKWTIDARFNKDALIQRIEKISLYKKRIEVTNLDGIELIKKLKNKKKFFLYLDPPYYVKGNCLYLNHYQHRDHQNLATFLNKNANMNWILSYDNVPEIVSFYKERAIQEFSLNYHADIARKGFELLILSDSIRLPKRNNQFI